jgi:hypothetical protein
VLGVMVTRSPNAPTTSAMITIPARTTDPTRTSAEMAELSVAAGHCRVQIARRGGILRSLRG